MPFRRLVIKYFLEKCLMIVCYLDRIKFNYLEIYSTEQDIGEVNEVLQHSKEQLTTPRFSLFPGSLGIVQLSSGGIRRRKLSLKCELK